MSKQKKAKSADVKKFALLIQAHSSSEVILNGSKDGLAVFVECGSSLYQLFTQRGTPRIFRSPATAVNFIAELGADRLVLSGLSNWSSDSYVNQNSRPKKKLDIEKIE